ncbi:MAG: rRNA maturation RNase YbeY [Myxococcota bacterium]
MAEVVDVLWAHTEPEDPALADLLRGRGVALLDAVGAPERELSILVTDDASMETHNARWRGVDAPTDVLSFPMDEGEALASGVVPPLGDVILSLDTARRQAEEHGHPVDHELIFLLVHGVCHLLGHDHAEPDEAARMRAEEDRLLSAVAPEVTRPPTPY